MGLKRLLGLAVGPSEYAPTPSVIGSVEQSNSGNAVLRIGQATVTDADHPAWTQTEYVVMTPEERDELIIALESQRSHRMIKCGDVVGDSAVVLAVHYVNGSVAWDRLLGTVLGWIDHKKTYVIYTADAYGEVSNGTYRSDSTRANNAYITRLNDHFFRHFNTSPPTITYASVPERDRLTEGQA